MKHLLWTIPILVAIPFWFMGHKEVRDRMVTMALFITAGLLMAAAGPFFIPRNVGVVLGRFHADLGVLISITAVGPIGIGFLGGSADQWAHNPPTWRSIAWRLFVWTACAWVALILSSGMKEDAGIIGAGPFLWGSVLIASAGMVVLAYPLLFGTNFLQPNKVS